MKKAFTLIELLIVVAIIAILAAIAVPNFLEAQTRSKVSRAKNDMRSLATAIEAYYVDFNGLPAYALNAPTLSGLNSAAQPISMTSPYNVMATAVTNGNTQQLAALNNSPSFALRKTSENQFLNTITTPVAYITAYPADPFKDTKGATFNYTGHNLGAWLTYSPGPDTDQGDGTTQKPCGQLSTKATYAFSETIINPGQWSGGFSTAGTILLTGSSATGSYTYDPTNGTTSKGDIWRSNQFNN